MRQQLLSILHDLCIFKNQYGHSTSNTLISGIIWRIEQMLLTEDNSASSAVNLYNHLQDKLDKLTARIELLEKKRKGEL